MPFLIIGDEVSLHKKVGEFTNEEGKILAYDHESVVYLQGEIVPDEEVSPVTLQQYERGDKHIRSLIVKCDENGKPTDDVPEPSMNEPVGVQPSVVSAGGTTGVVQQTDTGEKIVSTGVSTGNRPGDQGGGDMAVQVPVGGAPEGRMSLEDSRSVGQEVGEDADATKAASESGSKAQAKKNK